MRVHRRAVFVELFALSTCFVVRDAPFQARLPSLLSERHAYNIQVLSRLFQSLQVATGAADKVAVFIAMRAWGPGEGVDF